MSVAQADLLETIVAATRRIVEVRRAREDAASLDRRGASRSPRGARFKDALARGGAVNVIAECKRRSPIKGMLRASYDPAAIAAAYERAGAAAVSVLTEPTFFDGALEHLAAVRDAVAVPVLRKDFIVDEYQLLEARAAGADAVLLIATALDGAALGRLADLARALGLAALVEVHDEVELDRALAAGAAIVGVNNRNLRTLAVDLDTCERLAARIPSTVVRVAESGLRARAEIDALRAAGYDAFLIGERLMTAEDPGAALKELVGS